jgi:tellurite resistance protein TerC
MTGDWIPWIVFTVVMLSVMAVDLGLVRRKAHAVTMREGLIWTGVWFSLAMCFCVGIYFWRGPDDALSFLAGYLIEESLSVDNMFVFVIIFSYFKVAPMYQHRVLLWGVIGALVMRAIFIAAGVALIERFHWVTYVMGAFLVYTGIKLAIKDEVDPDPDKNPVLHLLKKFIPITHLYAGQRFFVRQENRLVATPLFVVLVVVETTDLVFAVDSIPAVLSITTDPFIVYTSNVFAIMGLRSLYFALAGLVELFHLLKYGLAAILVFVGVKMLLVGIGIHIPVVVALAVVVATLALAVILSLVFRPKHVEYTLESLEEETTGETIPKT